MFSSQDIVRKMLSELSDGTFSEEGYRVPNIEGTTEMLWYKTFSKQTSWKFYHKNGKVEDVQEKLLTLGHIYF